MKDFLRDFLLIFNRSILIVIYGKKFSVCFVFLLTFIMFFLKGFFVAFEYLGFSIFCIAATFVVLSSWLGIIQHQQEHIRFDFEDRVHQRSMLIVILTILVQFFTFIWIYNNPYALILF